MKAVPRSTRLLSRRGMIAGGLGAFALAADAGAWVHYVEPEKLAVRHYDLPVAGSDLRGPVRLAHLSDLHYSPENPLPRLERAFDAALTHNPDAVVITGDFITRTWMETANFQALVREAASQTLLFGTLGNHDGGAWAHNHRGYESSAMTANILRDSGVDLLQNRCATLKGRRGTILLAGVGDLWALEVHPEEAFSAIPRDTRTPTVLLSHNPDSKDVLIDYPWHIMLSGHTHGGQVVVPFLDWAPMAPVEDLRFIWGLHRWENRWLHITRGVGSLLNIRFNCPPEIVILDILPAGSGPGSLLSINQP